MKKILIATDSFLPRADGIAIFLREIIPKLRDRYEITVVAPDYGSLNPFFGFFGDTEIIRFKPSRMRFGDYNPTFPDRQRMRQLVSQSDIIFTQTVGPIGISAMNLAKSLKKPLISFVHSIEWELFSESIKRLRWLIALFAKFYVKGLYNKCSLLLVPSEEVVGELTQRGVSTDKQVVKLGVDSDRFLPPQNKENAKKRIGIKKNPIVIGFVGRIAREKDLPTLYKAYKMIHKKHEKSVLLLVGAGLKSHVPQRDDVIWVGNQKDVLPFYQAMDIYVLPSLTETTSLTTLEAMSCEVAVVATPVGLVKNYIKNRKNGWLFPKGNVQRLNIILDKLISDESYREYLGRQGRKTVKGKFGWDITITALKKAFERF